jgi:hypothetical protein
MSSVDVAVVVGSAVGSAVVVVAVVGMKRRYKGIDYQVTNQK